MQSSIGSLETAGTITELATLQGVVDVGAGDAGEVTSVGLQKFWQMTHDQGGGTFAVAIHAAQDFRIDDAGLAERQGRGDEGGLPRGEFGRESEIGVEEMATGPQHAGDFREETRKIGVTVRGFDIEDGIETGIGKRQVFGVTLAEAESGHDVPLLAKTNAGGIEVEPGVVSGVERARQVGRAAAVSATDFEHVLTAQVDLGRDVMIELDAGTVGFVGGRERQGEGWVGLESVVEKEDFVALQATREIRIPRPPDRLADTTDGK